MVRYTNKTLMPFGKHKGTALGNVPASYLLYCLSEFDNLSQPLRIYIEEKKEVLEAEVKKTNRFLSR